MKNILSISLFVVFGLLASSHLVQAQPPQNPPANPAAVPIDGGLGLLLAAGAGLGAKKAWDAKRKR
jgi:hypothetical protein